eukprot:4822556-Prymnesium_polylepis.1
MRFVTCFVPPASLLEIRMIRLRRDTCCRSFCAHRGAGREAHALIVHRPFAIRSERPGVMPANEPPACRTLGREAASEAHTRICRNQVQFYAPGGRRRSTTAQPPAPQSAPQSTPRNPTPAIRPAIRPRNPPPK